MKIKTEKNARKLLVRYCNIINLRKFRPDPWFFTVEKFVVLILTSEVFIK